MITETGQIISNANSYTTIAFADAYHQSRGALSWLDASTHEKEYALVKATDFVDAMYAHRFAGYKTTLEQSLAWPRALVYITDVQGLNGLITGRAFTYQVPPDVIPLALQKAVCEMARRIVDGDEVLSDIDRPVTQEQVGSIRVTYDKSAPTKVRYPVIDALLRLLLTPNSGSSTAKLVRC